MRRIKVKDSMVIDVLNGDQEQCSVSDLKDMLADGWRDVRKVLPDKPGYYLVHDTKTNNSHVRVLWFDMYHKRFSNGIKVVAWSELPKPPAFG